MPGYLPVVPPSPFFPFRMSSRLASAHARLALLACAALSPLSAEDIAGVPVTVLSRSVVETPSGTVTYLRIRPPALPTRPAPPPPAPDAPLTPELQAALERAEAKPFVVLAVTATVYTRTDGSAALTELTWRDQTRAYRAWSGADFRLLRQINDIETATHRFQWFPFINTVALADLAAEEQPAALALFPAPVAATDDAPPDYFLEDGAEDAAAAEPALTALDWLHAYYHLRRADLAADLLRRETEAAEQARRQAEEAAKPRHEKVYFWKIQ